VYYQVCALRAVVSISTRGNGDGDAFFLFFFFSAFGLVKFFLFFLLCCLLLHFALASCGAVYCNRSCLWVCDSGRAVSEPYTTVCSCQHARSVCVSLSAFFLLATDWWNKDEMITTRRLRWRYRINRSLKIEWRSRIRRDRKRQILSHLTNWRGRTATATIDGCRCLYRRLDIFIPIWSSFDQLEPQRRALCHSSCAAAAPRLTGERIISRI